MFYPNRLFCQVPFSYAFLFSFESSTQENEALFLFIRIFFVMNP